jgi:hypothetical protein
MLLDEIFSVKKWIKHAWVRKDGVLSLVDVDLEDSGNASVPDRPLFPIDKPRYPGKHADTTGGEDEKVENQGDNRSR